MGCAQRLRWCVTLVFAVLLLLGRSAWAQSGPADPWVEVLIAGSDAEVTTLAEALSDPLRRLHVRLQIRLRKGQVPSVNLDEVLNPSARSIPAIARMWFDLTEPGQAVLYITDGGWKRIYERRLGLPQGLDEVAREQLTYIARTSVETLLAGGQIGVSREEYESRLPAAPSSPPAPPPTPPPAPEASWSPSVGAFYEASYYANRVPITHGPGLLLSFMRSGSRLRPLLVTSAEWRFEQRADAGDVQAKLSGTALRIGIGTELLLGRVAAFRALVGGGTDLVHVTPEQGNDALVVPSDEFWTVDPLARFSLGLGFHAGVLSPWLTGGADIATRASHYIVWRDSSRETVCSPGLFRPWARLELWVDFR